MEKHRLDAIIAPTNGPAWNIDWVNGDHFSGSSSAPAAISGYPNITVPMGFVHGLPAGISIFRTSLERTHLAENCLRV
jgi:amidase